MMPAAQHDGSDEPQPPARSNHRRRLALCVGAGILAGSLTWGAGFLWFIQRVGRPTEPPPQADGIVALTGGAERVETALRLLREDRARLLLLSGIGGGADLAVLAHRTGLDPGPLADRVTLGRSATSTRGNALETASWVHDHDIHSLIVVTAFYHMPRALTELHRALPGVTLYPLPVLTAEHPGPTRVRRLVTLRLLAAEYSKYLFAASGLSTLMPERDASPPHALTPQ
jgi:uncharacterized SAM-binding protein YcdF (DUF218 family)